MTTHAPSIVVAEISTGKVLQRHQIPGGSQDANEVTLTPDGKQILLSRGSFMPKEGYSGEFLFMDRLTGKLKKRIRLEDGATSNVVFRYE